MTDHLTIEQPWAVFKKYLSEPYKNNPDLLTAQEVWFNDLYQRRQALELSYRRITLDENPDKSFEAFCLNDMYFSHDLAIYALPHLPNLNDPNDRSDRSLVADWSRGLLRNPAANSAC